MQLKLNKIGYTVQFADGAATEGVVVGETQPLDYCQFEVYAIRTSDLTEEQRELLARNSAFIAPQAGETVEKGDIYWPGSGAGSYFHRRTAEEQTDY